MEYIINQIKFKIEDVKSENEQFFSKICQKIAKKLKINQKNVKFLKIIRKSIDSRKKPDIYFSYNVLFSYPQKIDSKLVSLNNIETQINLPKVSAKGQPVIVGSGPSGLFAGLILARMGVKPIIIEQGKEASQRAKDVEKFWNGGKLNPKSNVQFGHGGAGSFSDGKLNTGIGSRYVNFVLNEFKNFGAGEEITYSATPHVGTDVLLNVIENMRVEIEKLGGRFLFEHTFENFKIKDGKICAAVVENRGKIFEIATDKIILCVGHSARKTFKMLVENGVFLKPKPLSIGLRIQHNQADISRSMYGEKYNLLPPADYKLSHFLENGRCVYTFCNCPGGYVVNASSEEGAVVCNGMSYSNRASPNANSAILVSVSVEDFGENSPLAGVKFQEFYEKKAYQIAKGQNLPIQKLSDFIKGEISQDFTQIKPVVKGGVVPADLNLCLPKFASESIKKAVFEFDKKIKGFANPNALLIGVETRSSSPVIIVRNQNFETNIPGLFSCGEGAGYAGGITSSAVDGVKLALKIYEEN